MKKLIFSLIIWVLSFNLVQAQGWEKEYQSFGKQPVYPLGETNTGYIFQTADKRSQVFKLEKESGEIIWTKEYNFSNYIAFFSMEEISEGRILMVGRAEGENGSMQNLIMITDSLGNEKDKKIWASEENQPSALSRIINNGDNTYTALESMSRHFALIKFNEALEIIWRKEYDKFELGFLITGIIKKENGILSIGEVMNPDFTSHPAIIKFDVNGEIVWRKEYTSFYSTPFGITKINNGYLIFGEAVYNEKHHAALFKIDEQGELVWFDNAVLDHLKAGYFMTVGEINNKYVGVVRGWYANNKIPNPYVVYFDTLGNLIHWQKMEKENPAKAVLTWDKHILITGRPLDLYPWAIKLTPLAVKINPDIPITPSFVLKQNYPNPFNAQTFIPFVIDKDAWVNLSIYNSKGEKVKEWSEHYLKGSHQINFQPEKFTSGIYFYQIKTENRTQTRKMLLIK